MKEKVLVSPAELAKLMKREPVVLIDTRDPSLPIEEGFPDTPRTVAA